ncbi:IS4 family transposase [Candidatus Gottesmanbacteria bacterium]|nr:IS4 family transposase [Candidatus Gottesmanbacteria bacterium]
MNEGKTVFSQVMEFLPMYEFRKCVERYRGDYKVLSFSCFDQFLCMAFAQMTFRESLRDIQACLRSKKNKLYHMGIRGQVSRNTLSNANNQRDWRIYADFAMILIHRARELYINEPFGIELDNTVYALDSTTIDLCLALFPWARFRKNKGAVKLHTLLDLRGNIPSFIDITDGKVHDVNVLDILISEAGSFYIMDRGYIDFKRLYELHQALAFFVIRAKSNLQYRRLYSRPVDKSTGLRCDQTIVLTQSFEDYPEQLRLVKFYDAENDLRLTFLTNNFSLDTLTIAQLYKCRWKVELFFKWIKQHLRIKAFFGTSENAVKTQVWIAVSIYVLIAIIKKRLALEPSLYTILQIFSVNIFEKDPICRLLETKEQNNDNIKNDNQLKLF